MAARTKARFPFRQPFRRRWPPPVATYTPIVVGSELRQNCSRQGCLRRGHLETGSAKKQGDPERIGLSVPRHGVGPRVCSFGRETIVLRRSAGACGSNADPKAQPWPMAATANGVRAVGAVLTGALLMPCWGTTRGKPIPAVAGSAGTARGACRRHRRKTSLRLFLTVCSAAFGMKAGLFNIGAAGPFSDGIGGAAGWVYQFVQETGGCCGSTCSLPSGPGHAGPEPLWGVGRRALAQGATPGPTKAAPPS